MSPISADNCSVSDMALPSWEKSALRTSPPKRKYGVKAPFCVRHSAEGSRAVACSPDGAISAFTRVFRRAMATSGNAGATCSVVPGFRCAQSGLRSSPLRQLHAQPSRQILDVLPRHAARARAARGCPFERLALELLAMQRNGIVANIAGHHGEVFVLAAT